MGKNKSDVKIRIISSDSNSNSNNNINSNNSDKSNNYANYGTMKSNDPLAHSDTSSGYETNCSAIGKSNGIKNTKLEAAGVRESRRGSLPGLNGSNNFKLVNSSNDILIGSKSRVNVCQQQQQQQTGHSEDGENGEYDSIILKEPGLVERMAQVVPCLGIIFSLCASLFLGSAGMLVKMTHSVHGVQVAVFRASIQSFLYGSIILFRGLSLKPARGELKPVLGRSLFGAASITLSYNALKLIPLADATTIRFSMPIWSLIIGYFVLKEKCGFVHILAVLACISGVALIAKPEFCLQILYLALKGCHSLIGNVINFNDRYLPEANFSLTQEESLLLIPADLQFAVTGDDDKTLTPKPIINDNLTDYYSYKITSDDNNSTSNLTAIISHNYHLNYKQLEGTLLALSSSICLALSLVSLRLCEKTNSEVIILWLSLASVTIGSVLLISINEWRIPDNLLDFFYIFLNGLFGSIGQWFITNALKIEQSGIISLTRTADIQVAFLYGALLLHEPIRTTSIVGSILVTMGVFAVGIPKINKNTWFTWCPCKFARRSSSELVAQQQSDYLRPEAIKERQREASDIEITGHAHLGDIPSLGIRKLSMNSRRGSRVSIDGRSLGSFKLAASSENGAKNNPEANKNPADADELTMDHQH